MNLVFIHGAGFAGDVFDRQLEEFTGAHAPNLPGHLTAGTPRTVEEFTDFVEAYVRSNFAGRAVLCGHSLGGAIAIETALRKNVRVPALVLIGSGAKLRVAPSILQRLESDFAGAASQLAEHFFAVPTAERTHWAVDAMRRVGGAQTLRDFQACDAFDALTRLAELTMPLLAVTGAADQMTPPKYAQTFADRVTGAQARIIPDAGHFVMVERPAETNAAIRAFLAGVP